MYARQAWRNARQDEYVETDQEGRSSILLPTSLRERDSQVLVGLIERDLKFEAGILSPAGSISKIQS